MTPHLAQLWSVSLLIAWSVQAQENLPGTAKLEVTGDMSAQMVSGIDKFLMREIQNSIQQRVQLWKRDLSSESAYQKSVEPNRERLRKMIGAVDPREAAPTIEFIETTEHSAIVAETKAFKAYEVRWPVFENVHAEGLMLRPAGKLAGCVIAIPDADQTPEMIAGLAPGLALERQFARRFAEAGCLVLIPTLIDRKDTWSGNAELKRFTNQPHREWIYRQAYELGRHIIGYEVQKILAAVDWFRSQTNSEWTAPNPKIAVAGYGEGGLIAFYSAALDTRIDAALVSGYFGSRQKVWEEPIYRNVFGLLTEFGDAEIATLITPRKLLLEYSESPGIEGPPPAQQGRGGAAPGKWATSSFASVESEFKRASALVAPWQKQIELLYGNEGVTTGPASDYAITALLKALSVTSKSVQVESISAKRQIDVDSRQKRQVKELEAFTQRLLRNSERVRDEFFWAPLAKTPASDWNAASEKFRKIFWEDVIGRFPQTNVPANPRTRKIYDKPKWTGYEVVLDVFPDVFAWGYLLVPKDIQPAEKRPVVVCQHGLEGVPEDVVSDDPSSKGYVHYKGYASRLADMGFVVYAPHNPYRGQDAFRVLQRKANPLKKSLFSIIIPQHQTTLNWISTLPFVDRERIGFYGLSYGGKTAMRVPSVLGSYALSICSADFNEWIRKNATTDSGYSYLFTFEYEMPEFNLGNTFNYAEMAALVAPRPFMVERGHYDGVAPDEWVAYEYARVRRLYARLGIPGSTDIEFFNGPHTINGVGTFAFLKKHLRWPGEK